MSSTENSSPEPTPTPQQRVYKPLIMAGSSQYHFQIRNSKQVQDTKCSPKSHEFAKYTVPWMVPGPNISATHRQHTDSIITFPSNTAFNSEMTTQHQHDIMESLEHAGTSSSSFAININNKLGTISSSSPEYTIFKVHEFLRKENEMAYEPEILSIGPYHRGKARLREMEDRKLHWLKASLKELGENDATEYMEAMKSLEPEARQCYSEDTSNVDEDDFVEMMLLDGCFIIQFMRRWLDGDLKDPFMKDWVIGRLVRDLIIFENQIPLFVLEELFSMIRLPKEPPGFHEFALSYFKNDVLRMMFSYTIPEKEIRSSNTKVHHILGFLHDLLRSLANNNNTNQEGLEFIAAQNQNIESIPSATKLHAAGVHFRSKVSKSQLLAGVHFRTKKVRKSQLSVEEQFSSPFDISFKNGVMEISTFIIDDYTESFYRNLIAYEQYSQEPSDRCVVLHASLMDCLIDSAEDVAVLRDCGIVGSALGDDKAVSTIFNKLVNNVTVSNQNSKVHSEVFQEVNAYSRKRRHKWMAKLRSDYFNSPWALISFFAAVFLLVLTLTQTVFSILGVV